LNFTNYDKNKKKSLANEDKLIVQLDSLQYTNHDSVDWKVITKNIINIAQIIDTCNLDFNEIGKYIRLIEKNDTDLIIMRRAFELR